MLKQNSIKGWSATPANVLTKLGNKTSEIYFALIVSGRIDPIDYLQTEIVFKQFAGGKFPHFKGLYFKPESWDGTDIFMAHPDINGKSTAFTYVTKKFVDVVQNSKISNISFINFNDYFTDCEMIKIGATELLKSKIDERIKKSCA